MVYTNQSTTLNALRRYLNDRGCIEARQLRMADEERQFIEFHCRMKGGKRCRAVLIADSRAVEIPTVVLIRIVNALAPCLGRGWQNRIPAEDPFG